jgi:hypothetical protein
VQEAHFFDESVGRISYGKVIRTQKRSADDRECAARAIAARANE